jgi:hypothetical protein
VTIDLEEVVDPEAADGAAHVRSPASTIGSFLESIGFGELLTGDFAAEAVKSLLSALRLRQIRGYLPGWRSAIRWLEGIVGASSVRRRAQRPATTAHPIADAGT